MAVYIALTHLIVSATMCHMVADTTEELLQMADKIGVQRKWIQEAGTPHEHFDICLSKKAKALKFGAKQITLREMGEFLRKKEAHSKELSFAAANSLESIYGGTIKINNLPPITIPADVSLLTFHIKVVDASADRIRTSYTIDASARHRNFPGRLFIFSLNEEQTADASEMVRIIRNKLHDIQNTTDHE